jgi:uncharacterized damage-inducible protein DinB
MSELPKWFERVFAARTSPDLFLNVCSRLAGTPARVEEFLARVPADLARDRLAGEWSILENAGHLADLEPLWAGRIEDFLEGRSELRAADLTNATTHAADHNATASVALSAAFRRARAALLARLEGLAPDDLERRSRHPRLGTEMGVMDLLVFVAEHDDQHLARMREIERARTLATDC